MCLQRIRNVQMLSKCIYMQKNQQCQRHKTFAMSAFIQVTELLSLLRCVKAGAAGDAPPMDLVDCLQVLSKHYDRALLDRELQRRLTTLKHQLKPLVSFSLASFTSTMALENILRLNA